MPLHLFWSLRTRSLCLCLIQTAPDAAPPALSLKIAATAALRDEPQHRRMRCSEGIDGGVPRLIDTLAGFEFRFEIYAFPLEVSFVWLTPSRPEAGRKLRITR